MRRSRPSYVEIPCRLDDGAVSPRLSPPASLGRSASGERRPAIHGAPQSEASVPDESRPSRDRPSRPPAMQHDQPIGRAISAACSQRTLSHSACQARDSVATDSVLPVATSGMRETPFDYLQHLVTVPVRLNGQERRFVLDSGIGLDARARHGRRAGRNRSPRSRGGGCRARRSPRRSASSSSLEFAGIVQEDVGGRADRPERVPAATRCDRRVPLAGVLHRPAVHRRLRAANDPRRQRRRRVRNPRRRSSGTAHRSTCSCRSRSPAAVRSWSRSTWAAIA